MTESRTTPPQPVEMATNALFDDTPNPPPDVTATKKSQWKHLFAFTRRSHAAPLVAALLASAATAGVKTALAVFLGKIFDVIGDYGTGERNGSDTVSTVSDWCLVLIGVGFGNWVASSAFLGLWIVFGELQAASVRQHVLSSLIYYDMAWFDTRDQGISSLLVRIQTQTRELQLATSQLLGLLISDTMTSLGSLCLAFYYSWKLTLVLLATLPISAGVLALATRPLDPAIQKQKGHLGSASKHVTSSISAIDLVNVFNGHDYQLRQYARSIRHAAQAYLVQARCNSIQMGYVSFWVISMFVVGFWYGLDLVEHGLSPGDVLTTFYATLASFQGIEALMPHWLVLSKGMSAGAFLKDVVAENSQSGPLTRKEQTRHAITPDRCFGRVELSHVAFAYPSTPDTLVVEHVSLLFPAGETTFIVGTSGSGKSTIGSLVCNLYEPLAGYIRIDGKPIKALDPSWVQDNINLVQQSSVLFDDTLFNNVALGGRDPESVSRQQVLAACDAAMLQTTIAALPDGLDTNIGPEGHTLSGGQKQRVALARAFLRDAPVMILDEITSGLDYVTRSLVMNSIRARRRNKTTIIITHDTSQIASDDFVYVMKNHRLVQQGLHSQLLTQDNGHFMALVAKESTPAPLTIDITPPDDDASSLSTRPETPLVRSRSTRVADFVVDRIGNGSLYPGSPPPSNRLSFGIPVNYSLRLRREDVAAQEAPIPSAQNVELDAPEWTEEMKRFSTYLSSHFSLGSEYQQLHSPAATLTLPTTSEVIHEESIRRPSLRSSHRSSHRTSYPNSVINYSPSVYSVRDSQFSESGDIELTCTDPYKAVRSDTPPYSRFDPFHDEGPLLDNDIALSKPPKKKDSIFTVLGTVWPGVDVRDRLTLILGIISGIIGATATPAFSYAFAQLLGVLTSPGDKAERGTKWACIMLGLAIIDGVCWGGSRYLLERVAVSWVDKMRNEALKRILLQPRPWFAQSKNSAGRISECLDRNAEEMRNIVGKFIPIVVAVVTMISVSVIWALAVSWKLALVALTPLPAMLGAVKIFTILSSKWEDRCNKVAEDASATATEILVNVRILRSFALERYFTKRYTQRVHQTLLIGLKRAVFTCGAYGLYQSLNYAMTCLVFYYGTVLLADKKELVVADVMQVINLLLFSIGTATGILSGIPQLTMAQATASQMIAYANMPTSPPDSQTGHAKPMTPLPISMKNLTYSRNHNVILRGVSLDIQPGRCTAIVGHSGCGKSTIVSLLLGLEAASNTGTGYLTYSSIPSNHVDLGYMRRRADMMSYVPQAAVLFPASILDNITYGLPMDSPLRSADNVVYAARAASLHEWIMSLPQGYATIVGDGGQALSGGQAQRLSIARALVRHPALLVLDEPTSALDADNAAVIKQAIRNAQSPGRAVVLVTHSQDMMSAADHIIVLGEGGVVVQQGSYQELVTTKGAFANLVGSGVEDI